MSYLQRLKQHNSKIPPSNLPEDFLAQALNLMRQTTTREERTLAAQLKAAIRKANEMGDTFVRDFKIVEMNLIATQNKLQAEQQAAIAQAQAEAATIKQQAESMMGAAQAMKAHYEQQEELLLQAARQTESDYESLIKQYEQRIHELELLLVETKRSHAKPKPRRQKGWHDREDYEEE